MFFNQLSAAQPCDNGSIWWIVISFGWMALLYCSFDFLFCLRWPFFITLMYKLDRNVHVSHPLSLYQRGKTQIVSACQTFSVASLSCVHPTFVSSANLLFPSRVQTGTYCSRSNLSGQRQFFPSPFFGWMGEEIEDVHQ